MSLTHFNSPSIPILPLTYPLILLPSTQVSIPISKDQARSCIAIVQENADRDRSRNNPAQNVIGAVPSLPPPSEVPQLSGWGCAARIVRIIRPSPLRQGTQPYVVILQGISRFQLESVPTYESLEEVNGPLKVCAVVYPPNEPAKPTTIKLFREAAVKLLHRLNNGGETMTATRRDAWNKLLDLVEDVSDDRLGWFADIMVGAVSTEYSEKLEYLSTPTLESRLTKAISMFTKQATISEVSKKISKSVSDSLSKQQKEFFLRQQLTAIQRELASITGNGGEMDDDDQTEADDMADLKRKIEAMGDDTEEKKMATREYRRLKRIPQGSVEQGVIRSYLEWLTAVPWPSSTPKESVEEMKSPKFLVNARAQLDNDHFGLEKIKKRLVEYLAVVRLKAMLSSSTPPQSSPESSTSLKPRTINRAPILLFVGPPGVGKTSLGQSIARALNRPFARISLGGVRDEAEIRGHRRTYVASGPGNIIQALRKAGRSDPVLLLDEIDKVGQSNFHGDPSAALLEVLDPEQNHGFMDHYINVPVDLSGVLFICTANTLDTISAPLLDRCEVVHLSGYTYDEKMAIAKRFLVPKQVLSNGLMEGQVEISDEALEVLASGYTREAGVRSLERVIGSVVRSKVVEFADSPSLDPSWKRVVQKDELEGMLGPMRWEGEEKEREERRGVVWGLVVMGLGEGAIMPIETVAVPGNGKLKLTGSLGDVIKESADIALTWVKTRAFGLGVTSSPSQDALLHPESIDVHLHLPSGAQKKDGPSAGIAMVCALVSLLTGATVGTHIAMTGEITLRGNVTPVGGIKEKVLGAHRAKVTKVILPFGNKQDVEQDVPREIREVMEFVFVRRVEDVLVAAFGEGMKLPVGIEAGGKGRRGVGLVESRL